MQTNPFSLIWSILVFTMMAGCEINIETFSIRGTVLNVTEQPVRNAEVALFNLNNEFLTSIRTDRNGNFVLSNVETGKYRIGVDREGYELKVEEITIAGSDAEAFELVLEGEANVTGRILDSNGNGVPFALIYLFEGDTVKVDIDSLQFADLILRTNSDGRYLVQNAPAGVYNGVIVSPGFIEQILDGFELEVGYEEVPEQTIISEEEVADGKIRIVLSWGEEPEDLDTHLTGPADQPDNPILTSARIQQFRFHLFFGNRRPPGADVILDQDVVQADGRETATIGELMDGIYRYSVHNFTTQDSSGAQGIYDSPTKVEVFDATGLLQSYSPPEPDPDAGNVWRVFEMEANNDEVTFTELATYDYVQDISDAINFRTREKTLTVKEGDF